jgi:hypothetical protein
VLASERRDIVRAAIRAARSEAVMRRRETLALLACLSAALACFVYLLV